jgi:hypothetical protein
VCVRVVRVSVGVRGRNGEGESVRERDRNGGRK